MHIPLCTSGLQNLRNHQTSKERIRDGQEWKTCRNYDIDITNQEFVIGFCQIALDLFRTLYNTHTI
jgi:hypothetical protein